MGKDGKNMDAMSKVEGLIAETKLKLIEVQIGEEISVQDKEKHELE